MKHEWRKKEKKLYIAKENPEVIMVENQKFITIKGEGNPNEQEFSDKVGVLYTIAYKIKMMPKSGFTPENFFDYTVYPLEGIWDSKTPSMNNKILNKDDFIYKIMIRQPDFVTKEIFQMAVGIIEKQNSTEYLKLVEFEEYEEGMCVQMMHLGSFDREYESFEVMQKFIAENDLELLEYAHKEIYISDKRKTKEENFKTVLRYRVKKIN